MRKIAEFRKWLTNLNYIQFIGLQTSIGLLVATVLYAINSVFEVSTPTRNGYAAIPFLLLLLVSAIIETILFQYLPFVLTAHRRKNIPSKKIFKPTRYVFLSSVVFGLFHIVGTHWMMPFVVFKVLSATLYGVVLSVSFYIFWRKNQKPILSVSLIHFLMNSIIVFLGYLIELMISK